MKKLLSSLAIALFALSAHAAAVSISPTCANTDITSAVDCEGSLLGNDVGYNTTSTGVKFGQMAFDFGALTPAPFALLDTTDNASGSQLALIFGSGGSSGSLLINDPNGELYGNLFGISLKSSLGYSLYLFDAATAPLDNVATGWTELAFSTIGTATNWKGTPQNLSHASLWGFALSPNSGANCATFNTCDDVTPVPEPSTWALMAAGLGAIAFTRRRRAVQA